MAHVGLLLIIGLALCLTATAHADEPAGPQIKVVPWNGATAAVSLTFDDGEPVHLDNVMPNLDRHGWKGTFFIIANQLNRRDEWKQAFANGHELGNHTKDHPRASALDANGVRVQVIDAQKALETEFGVPVRVFAYPFTETSPEMIQQLSQSHLAARIGMTKQVVLTPEMEPDWMQLPSRVTMSADTQERYAEWAQDAVDQGGWLIVMIHSVAGTWYQPISVELFNGLLDELAARDIWVAPMGTVAAYWKGQKILEQAARESLPDGGVRWTWTMPEDLPSDVIVKVRLTSPTGTAWTATQDDKALTPTAGVYTVQMNAGALTFAPTR